MKTIFKGGIDFLSSASQRDCFSGLFQNILEGRKLKNYGRFFLLRIFAFDVLAVSIYLYFLHI